MFDSEKKDQNRHQLFVTRLLTVAVMCYWMPYGYMPFEWGQFLVPEIAKERNFKFKGAYLPHYSNLNREALMFR